MSALDFEVTKLKNNQPFYFHSKTRDTAGNWNFKGVLSIEDIGNRAFLMTAEFRKRFGWFHKPLLLPVTDETLL